MMKIIFGTILTLTLVAKSFAYSGISMPSGDDSWKSTDLGHGIYMLQGKSGNPGGNLGLLVGDEGVLLIDSGLKKAANVTLEAVEKVAGREVDFVINTHIHADHLAGNFVFAEKGATIIAHENTRKALLKDEKFNKKGLPHVAITDKTSLHLNGQTIELITIPDAHTDSDIIIYFPEANVIHAGDMVFKNIFPNIDLRNGGDIDRFIAGQYLILDLGDDDTKIIPGHGTLATKADIKAGIDMLTGAKNSIKSMIDKGMNLEEILKQKPLEKYNEWSWFYINNTKMTMMIYGLLTN
ncbi:MBL fold metallo-hydrolase [Vibrio sp. HN007]|uniref:MBL fold metallo-hydrolase n=1 Tax=Vibrio iocasae TaxID=3098914 RepID=UPI0035D3EB58